jgi:hypothetical protein
MEGFPGVLKTSPQKQIRHYDFRPISPVGRPFDGGRGGGGSVICQSLSTIAEK